MLEKKMVKTKWVSKKKPPQKKKTGFKEEIQLVKLNDSAALCNLVKQQGKAILLNFIALWVTLK